MPYLKFNSSVSQRIGALRENGLGLYTKGGVLVQNCVGVKMGFGLFQCYLDLVTYGRMQNF
jgi:hypothetical protein